MKVKVSTIINLFTDVDEITKGCSALNEFSINKLLTLGRFHHWAEQYVNDDDISLDQEVELPEEFREIYDSLNF